MLMSRWLQQRFSSCTFRWPRFEACGCSAGFSACGVMLPGKLAGDKDTPPQGAARTQALLFTQMAECSWQGIQICQFSLSAVRTGQHHLPTFILTSSNAKVSSPPSTKYHADADWENRKILFHEVMTDFRCFWQEPEGKHQNILFLLKTSLPFQYSINRTCWLSWPSSRLLYCWEILEVATIGLRVFKRKRAAEKGNEESSPFWVFWKWSCAKQICRKERVNVWINPAPLLFPFLFQR